MQNKNLVLSFPHGKRAAVVVAFDDVHPARSAEGYEAGGDLDEGVLGLVSEVLNKHPQLMVTLFVTADWREKYPFPTGIRRWISCIPRLADHFYLAPLWPEGTHRLDRHPAFTAYVKSLPRTEIAVHGLYHASKGVCIPDEFRLLGYDECLKRLSQVTHIFNQAGLTWVKGTCPPGWEARPPLLHALENLGFVFVSSARDLWTPISSEASCSQRSGIKGLPLIFPSLIPGTKLVHIPSNWSSINTIERARRIIENGGVLSVKGHVIKKMGSYIAEDGLDRLYCNYLHALFLELENHFEDQLWYTTMGKLAEWFLHSNFSEQAACS